MSIQLIDIHSFYLDTLMKIFGWLRPSKTGLIPVLSQVYVVTQSKFSVHQVYVTYLETCASLVELLV